MNYSQITVCVLISTQVEEDSFRQHLHFLEECDNNVQFFSDPDQCVESLILTQHRKYLCILGSRRCHLVDILSSFPSIVFIYLTENHHFEDASYVRGIYFNPQQLIIKLKKDLKIIENYDLNFNISSSLEINMSGTTTTQDIQHDRLAFNWIRVILYAIVNTPKPKENIYEDMLKQCRQIYRDNQSMCQKIDDFEKTYNPKNAIWWYTKDSFVYRQINAAFRAENILNIWKFRFIIQDIYKQLELLHEKQMTHLNSTSGKIHHLYRGQRMSSNELKRIQENVDHLIAINSFLSTTLNYSLAETWAGNGEDRPKFQSVLFEILIDECRIQNVPIIFANIVSESNFEEEQEVLLSMGTVLHIDSVQLEGNIWKICLHVYEFNDGLCQNVEMILPKLHSHLASSENFVQLVIACILFEMGSFEKSEQICQLTSSFEDPFINIMRNLLKEFINLYKLVRMSHLPSQATNIKEQLNQIKKSVQQIKQLLNPEHHDFLNVLETQINGQDFLVNQYLSSDVNIFEISKSIGNSFFQAMRQRQLLVSKSTIVPNDSSVRNCTDLIDDISSDDETFESMNFEQMKFIIDQNLVKNDPRRIGIFQMMALKARKKNEYDQAIEFLQNALLIPSNDDQRATVYNHLGKVYEKQNNWSEALQCYENIINMSQLSETSLKLRLAYINAARMYEEMQDDHNAIVHYKRGVQLYCQYDSPHHPIVSSYKIVIGMKFQQLGDMDAALNTFQEVIKLDHSNDIKVAYKQIAMIYIFKDNYDMASFNFNQSLKIARFEINPDMDFIIDIHRRLACIEFLRRHFDEVYVHLNEAINLSENYQCTETTREEIQSTFKMFTDLKYSMSLHNQN